jgi:hypothetical protein
MLWWLAAAFFLWLALRELYFGVVPKPGYLAPETISKTYLLLALAIALGFAWVPLRTLQFERFLTSRAKILSGSNAAHVHCNTFFDTALDPMQLAIGHADPETGRIVLQKPWCSVLRTYLRHPQRLEPDGVMSLQMFAHETMHIRGERNEAVTECQAIQRYVRAALLLGVPSKAVARANGMKYYQEFYQQRQQIGGMQAQYYTDQCAPGKALDEHLADSTWNP